VVQGDTQECAAEIAPAACAVVSRARMAGATVLRAGYSAVGPETWIRPHTGTSNAQLKLHLGLRVPQSPVSAVRSVDRVQGEITGLIIISTD
jgi:hypothetical protein